MAGKKHFSKERQTSNRNQIRLQRAQQMLLLICNTAIPFLLFLAFGTLLEE
jgi:hypothetical protein